jgi:DME family drug/metabolite transporter
LLYLGLVPTALGYVIFLYGMKTTPATVASIATLVEPLTGTLLAMVLFGERLAPAGWIGALLLLGAMGLLYLNGRRA